MISKLDELKNIMQENGYTCVVTLADGLYTSQQRGVKPLLELLDSCRNVGGAFAADKVVGKAAAFIYAKLGVAALYASIISKPALDVINNAGITLEYDELVDAILNRRGDGFCPMESAVRNIEDADDAIAAIRERLENI